jgi:hypothetical protein
MRMTQRGMSRRAFLSEERAISVVSPVVV